MPFQPSLGAWPEATLTRFRVWAPEAKTVELCSEELPGSALPFHKSSDGFFEGATSAISPGDLYRYRVDGRGPSPDPASRFQPQGVHGPSQVIDPAAFAWTDAAWTGITLDELILYELHVGTFTPEGTFAAATDRLPLLVELGVTAVEVMPIADFPGTRNWGYDGVALYAPARCYGTPDDFRRFVNRAHRLGLAVHLDVVYNHFGPDGAYMGSFSPYYFSSRHCSPWGDAINLSDAHSAPVRQFLIENALHWVHEYHVDGLRLDATHAMVDESKRHFLAELSATVRESLQGSGRNVLLIAEDVRNLACMVKPLTEKGWGLDAVWSDDFHHQVRRFLTGDQYGYFQDFEGKTEDIALTATLGWFYCGEYSRFFEGPRGTDPRDIAPERFVFFIQNHDQIGNRPFGDRMNHQIDLAAYRATTALLLLLPETPLLFMGQEWAAGTPFQYFTDHHDELGNLVREGRRNEFSNWPALHDPETRRQIPDPQATSTFEASRLRWSERQQEPHLSTLLFYSRLLALRRTEPAWRIRGRKNFEIGTIGDSVLTIRRQAAPAPPLLAVVRLRGSGRTDLTGIACAQPGENRRWKLLLTSEDPAFAPDSEPARVELSPPAIDFSRPGVVILKSEPHDSDKAST